MQQQAVRIPASSSKGMQQAACEKQQAAEKRWSRQPASSAGSLGALMQLCSSS